MKKCTNLIFWIGLLALWQASTALLGLPRYLIPSPMDIWLATCDDAKLLFSHALVTTQEWGIGLFFSMIFGVAISFSCFSSVTVRAFLHPLLVVSQSVPYLVFAPLLMIWLGLDMQPKIVLIVLTCSFPIAFVLLDGLERSREEYKTVIGLLRLSRLRAFWHVYRSAGLPFFFSGLKISVAYAYVSAVMAELIGSSAGLGVYMTRAQNSFRTDKVMAAVVIVVLLSLISTAAVEFASQKIVFWKTEKK